MIGASIARTGTPAAASCRIASSRAAGVLVRGSIARARSASSVVTLTFTCASRNWASCTSKSRSRTTSAFFVMMLTHWRASSMTSNSDA